MNGNGKWPSTRISRQLHEPDPVAAQAATPGCREPLKPPISMSTISQSTRKILPLLLNWIRGLQSETSEYLVGGAS